MATAEDLLDLARSYIGLTESPAGSNRQPFAAMAGHANGYAWCATFGVALQKKLGLEVVADSAYTPTCANMAKKAQRLVSLTDAQPGDHAVVDFSGGKNRIEHYVVIEKNLGNGMMQTIEGNTSGGGSQTNGGAVLRKVRNFKQMRSYVIWRPYYQGSSATGGPSRPSGALIARGDEGGTVIIWQQQLRDQGFDPDLVADGDFGPLTESATRIFQSRQGLRVTGWVSQEDVDEMGRLYESKAPEPVQPSLAVAVRHGRAPADERMARALAAAMHVHVGSLDARQEVGKVYLVGMEAVTGFDRGLASKAIELGGLSRQETWTEVSLLISTYLDTI